MNWLSLGRVQELVSGSAPQYLLHSQFPKCFRLSIYTALSS